MKGHFYDDALFNYEDYWQGRDYEDACEKRILTGYFRQIEKSISLKKLALLDIGAGFGRLAEFYLPRVNEAVLLEPSRKLIEKAKEHLSSFKNLKFLNSTIETAKLEKEYFELVLMIRTLHHLSHPELVFKKVYSSLRPGGFFILEIPNKNNLKNIARLLARGRFKTLFSTLPQDRRSAINVRNRSIPFYNYHPALIQSQVRKIGFRLIKASSVSNLRSPFLKRHFSVNCLLRAEGLVEPFFSLLSLGPSIFVLAQKPQNA